MKIMDFMKNIYKAVFTRELIEYCSSFAIQIHDGHSLLLFIFMIDQVQLKEFMNTRA